MTNREIDAAIAKVMGWKVKSIQTSSRSWADAWVNEAGQIMAWYREWKPTSEISATHQMEAQIDQTPNLFNEYISALTDILQIPKTGQGFSKGEVWAFMRATPKQRCQAALEAVGVEVMQ